jgi:hypothetical protein
MIPSLKQLSIEKAISKSNLSQIDDIQNEFIEPYVDIKYDILTDETEIKEKLITLLKLCSQQYVLKFVDEHKCEKILSECAAIVGRLDILKYIYENNIYIDNGISESDTYICNIIAKNNHLECLKYINSVGYNLHYDTIYFALESKEIECFLYIYIMQKRSGIYHEDNDGENCSPYNNQIVLGASQNGNLKCLKYLIENRTDNVYSQIFYESAVNGHLDCLKYIYDIIENIRKTCKDSDNKSYSYKCEYEHLSEYSALYESNLDSESHQYDTYLHDYEPVNQIKVLYKNYYLRNPSMANCTAINGHLDCLSFIIKLGCNFSDLKNIKINSFNKNTSIQNNKKILNFIYKIFYIYCSRSKCDTCWMNEYRHVCGLEELQDFEIEELNSIDNDN